MGVIKSPRRAERDFITEHPGQFKRKIGAATGYNKPSRAKENSWPRPIIT